MAAVTRNSGIRITTPETLAVSDLPPASGTSARRGDRATRSEAAVTPEHAAIAAAMDEQELHLADQFVVSHTVSADARRRRGGKRPPTGPVQVDVEVDSAQSAVILIEQEGEYRWKLPDTMTPSAAAPSKRRAPAAATRKVTFSLDVAAVDADRAEPVRRGFLADLARSGPFGAARVFVLKFAAPLIVDGAITYLERHVRPGLVLVKGVDPTTWERVETIGGLALPADRPARVLLLIHGTFSSTVGGFGALGATPWGRALLDSANANYDAVIGYDHATLSANPLENAIDLGERFGRFDQPFPMQVDVVTHSRGGLVVRALTERVLPRETHRPVINTVIFVGVPNAGTGLAEPDNWHALVDLYTNLAAAAFRVLQAFPQAAAPALVLKETVKSVGSLVKYLATQAVSDDAAPGLAAMEPDGTFVTQLNETQPGQPTVESTDYCAVTSEFVPSRIGAQHPPTEIPPTLMMRLADGFIDRLLKGDANDLVVNTSSMEAIDPQAGKFIKDTLAFGKTPYVYHTVYFARPEVTNAVARWLRLASAETIVASPRRAPLRPEAVRPGTMVGADARARVDTDIIAVAADRSIASLAQMITNAAPSYVVLQRLHADGTLHYAFAAEEALERASRVSGDMTLTDAFQLHDYDASRRVEVHEALPPVAERRAGPAARTIVFDQGRPVGVVADATVPSMEDLIELAYRIDEPKDASDSVLRRRAMPTFARPAQRRGVPQRARRGAPETAPLPPSVDARRSREGVPAPEATCFFRAEMPDQVTVGVSAALVVTIQREAIEALAAPGTAVGTSPVEETQALIIQIVPRRNFELEEGGRTVIPVPEVGRPATLMYSLAATSQGDGEVWVVARQGAVPLVTLILKPRVVDKIVREGFVSAEALAAKRETFPADVQQLRIFEQETANGTTYLYDFYAPGLNLSPVFNSPRFKADRAQYVDGLYKQIEDCWAQNKADRDAFFVRLRAFGGQLFDDLFPPEMQRVLWDNREKLKSIMVLSTEPFIPWELVHLKEPGKTLPKETLFLGQLGLVRWLHGSWPPQTLRIRPKHAFSVIPNYRDSRFKLPQATKEFEFLKREFDAQQIEPTFANVMHLLQTPGSFDLLHFACHGEADPKEIGGARLLLQASPQGDGSAKLDTLQAVEAEQTANLESESGDRPVIVLNACQVGRAGTNLTSLGGFARAFLNRGAGAFIGTLWSVGDAPARTFTERFYAELKTERTTISEATMAAREAARDAGDATWLAYVVYGHPSATLTLN